MVDRLFALEEDIIVTEMCGTDSCSYHGKQEAEK